MATLEIPSNVKCITSGQVPTTANLKDGEFAFGKVGGIAKLYGNVNGVIIDFTGDGGGDVSFPIVFSGASPGPSSDAVVMDATYESGYPAAPMIKLKYQDYAVSLSPVGIAIKKDESGHTHQIELSGGDIRYTYDDYDYAILRADNVKTLFGNQSIYGSGNIDLYRHQISISTVYVTANKPQCDIYIDWISSKNIAIDSLTDLFTYLNGHILPVGGTIDSKGEGLVFEIASTINITNATNSKIDFIDSYGGASSIKLSALDNPTVTDTITTV